MSTTATTTTDRAAINRRNAQNSTGPRTAEGKSRSRFNALKHGLDAKTLVLPGEDPDVLQVRFDSWTADLAPRNDVEQYLVDRAVRLSWQLDRADRAETARLATIIRSAPEEEALRQQDEVLALGRRLFWDRRGPVELYPHFPLRDELLADRKPRTSFSGLAEDPDDPARLVLRLEATAAGCQWLLDRWAELRELLEQDLIWQGVDRLKAIRMLGKQPMDAADDPDVTTIYQACWVLHPRAKEVYPFDDVWNELLAGEAESFKRRLNERAVGDFLPENQDDAKAKLLAIVGSATDRLKVLASSHAGRDQADQAQQAARLSFDDSQEGERLRRSQMSCGRALHKILDALWKIRRSEAKGKPGLFPESPSVPVESEPVADSDTQRLVGEDDDPAPPEWVAEPRSAPQVANECRISANEPTTATEHQEPENEPTTTTTEHRIPRNEPRTAAPEHQDSRNEAITAPAAAKRSRPADHSRKATGAACDQEEHTRRIITQCNAIL